MSAAPCLRGPNKKTGEIEIINGVKIIDEIKTAGEIKTIDGAKTAEKTKKIIINSSVFN